MHVKKSIQSDTLVTLAITADTAELEKIKTTVLKKLSRSVRITGFREGKAPLALVEKSVDQNALHTEFLDAALTEFYNVALKSEDVRPVTEPKLQISKFVPFTTLEFEVEVTTFGKVTLPDYKKIKKTMTAKTVEKADIEEVLTTLRTRAATKEDVTRPAALTDQVWIDFKGVDDKGKAISGAEGKDYPIVLGSKTFIPGFEENVVGLSAGEEKQFDVVFPKDYGTASLQNKKVTFTVTVNKVQVVVLPELNDAFAATVGPFKTVLELRTDIERELTAERVREARRLFENELVSEITKKSTVAVPDVLVEEQIDRAEQEEKQNLMYRGQTWEEHLKEEGVNEEEHREQKRAASLERVKAGLVLAEIADKEKIEILPEELEIRMQMLKGQYTDKAMQDELEKPDSRREIAARMLTEKTLDLLVESATKK
jgi:trigger factor